MIKVKKRLLDIIRCPKCKGKLDVKPKEIINDEIKEGVLMCTCGISYKILNYVPRFVDTDEYVGSFSFEWDIHRTTQLDADKSSESEETLKVKTGFDLRKLEGKLVLDVGCGMGRFMDIVQKYGGEVVGVDLSYAVNAAFKNIGLKKNVHVIQADIFELPFDEYTFDFIYSIGVLHHTPNAENAFRQLPKLLKRGGQISIWVYGCHKLRHTQMSQIYRKITTRLPKGLLHVFCYSAIPIYYLEKIPLISYPIRLLLPISLHKKWDWRVLDTFDWYSPRYQSMHTYPEVFRWFENAGLGDIRPLEEEVSTTGVRYV